MKPASATLLIAAGLLGAGALTGWTRLGTRPEFLIVTGVALLHGPGNLSELPVLARYLHGSLRLSAAAQ